MNENPWREIKRGASVKILSTGKYGIIADYQRVHNRYQLEGVSGWQYGIGNIEKQSYESLHAEIEKLREIQRALVLTGYKGAEQSDQ